MKIKITTLSLLLAFYTLSAQKNLPLQKLTPKRFIDKVEILVGPNITFPNANDPSAKNPDFNIRYNPKLGYSVGIGLIHTIKNFELKARVSGEQRSYVKDFSIASTKYEFITDTKNSYLSFTLIPTIFIGKAHRFHFYLGASYDWLKKSKTIQNSYLNGQLIQSYRTTNSSIQGIKDNVIYAVVGCGYLIFSKRKKEISAMLQDNFGITDVANQNGLIIKNNSLQLIISLKIIR